ncbi:MAG: hypothetical protein MH825_07005 [Cyanobacteria bacterium]|nr:hypothetical protein [Cyanobacteriota bacterium]
MADRLTSLGLGSVPPSHRLSAGARSRLMRWGMGAIAILLGSWAGPGAANEPIPFGQPLPGRPPTQPTETVEAAAPETVTATFEPLEVRPGDVDEAVRVELRLPTSEGRAGDSQRTAPDDGWATRQPQPQPQAATSPDSSQVGGWLEEAAIAPTPRDPRQNPQGGGSTGTDAAIAALGAGPYGVYVMDDRLSTLEQVSRLSANATFATYGSRTAIQAGVFERQGDAIARVRELGQLGLTAEIAPVPPMASPAIAAATAPTSANGSSDFVDPSLFFANFNPAPSEAAPIPERAGRPPVADPDKALPLPAPPPLPTAAAPAAGPTETWTWATPEAQPQPQPLARLNSTPPAIAPAPSEAIPYAIRLVGSAQQFAQWQASLRRAGIPEDNTALLNDNGTTVLEVGPFLSFAIAARWRDYLRQETGQAVEIYANGWVVETDLANP